MISAMFGIVRQVSAEEFAAAGARDFSKPGWIADAKRQGLRIHTWSAEPDADPRHYCLVGALIREADLRESSMVSIAEAEVAAQTAKVRQKLKDAGIADAGQFHFVVDQNE